MPRRRRCAGFATSSVRVRRKIEAAGGPDAYRSSTRWPAQSPVGSRGLLFLPYLATAATPRWNAQARAAWIGLSFAHGRAEMIRAVMEGVALEIRDMFEQWRAAGLDVDCLRIGGGATRSTLWNQIQADVYGRPVETLRVSESTSLGAALMGGLGAGVFASLEEGVVAMVHVADRIEPCAENHRRYDELYQAYVKAYEGLAGGGAFAALAQIQASD